MQTRQSEPIHEELAVNQESPYHQTIDINTHPMSLLLRKPISSQVHISPQIPHRLIFTHGENILITKRPTILHDNIDRTIRLYREFWNNNSSASSKNATDVADPVWFLDNEECLRVVGKVEPRLVPYFQQEERGDFKGDICRVAALYLRGGYYFDIDMQVIEPVPVPPHISFVTALSEVNQLFFQSILFSEPLNPILKESMALMLSHYQRCEGERALVLKSSDPIRTFLQLVQTERRNPPIGHVFPTENDEWYLNETESIRDLEQGYSSHSRDWMQGVLSAWQMRRINRILGPRTLTEAYFNVVSTTESPQSSETIQMLQESYLHDVHNEPSSSVLYPALARQDPAEGIGCNFVVHDKDRHVPYFYSRLVGTDKCQIPVVKKRPVYANYKAGTRVRLKH